MGKEALQETKLQLHAAYPVPLSAARIHRDAKKAGYTLTLSEIKAALQFLVSDDVAEEKEVPGEIESAYRLTAKGVRHCTELFA